MYKTTFIILIALTTSLTCQADIFKNIETGETFNGYLLQQNLPNKATASVLQQDEGYKTQTIDPADYEITYSTKGRRNNIVLIPVDQEEILLSRRVSETLNKIILQAANKGPRYIILSIDNPGGRGENMKIVCDQISSIAHCPIIAYISGGTFSGVHAAATGIVMACDEIYIAPKATLSTIPLPSRSISTTNDTSTFYQTFLPQNLASYSSYVGTLAEKNNRPPMLAIGLINTSIEVIEVETEKSKSVYINGANKLPSMKLIQNWSRTAGTLALPYDPYSASGSETATEAKEAMQLTLTAEQAVKTGIARKTVSTLKELYKVLNASDAKLMQNTLVSKEARRFRTSKNKINAMLNNIDVLNARADELTTIISDVNNQNVNDLARNNQQYQNQNQNNYYDSAIVASNRSNRNSNRNNRNVRSRSDQERYDNINARNRNNQINSNALNAAIQAKNVRLYQLKTELYATYNNLISNYSGILKLARTYPGSVPEDVDLTALQSDLSLTVTQRNALR